MRITISHTLSQSTANIFGEWLRDRFFDQSKGFGCYTTFELLGGVEKLDPFCQTFTDSLDDECQIVWNRAYAFCQGYPVVMAYYWDGDGTLEFNIDDRWVLSNSDCKKDHYWILEEHDPVQHKHLRMP